MPSAIYRGDRTDDVADMKSEFVEVAVVREATTNATDQPVEICM